MRVLHVTGALAPRLGGPSKVAVEMCEALAARGVDVTLFSTNLDEQGRWSPFESPDVVSVPTDRSQVINRVERRYFQTAWPSRFAFSPNMARALGQRVGEFDLVHVHSLYLFTTVAACHYAQRRAVPYIVRPHGTLDPYLRRRHSLRKAIYDKFLQRRQLDRAAAIHYTSEDERELARLLGIRAPGVVVPLGVNLEEFAGRPAGGAFRALHPQLKDKQLIVFLGRLTPKKGLDLLIEAFSLVARAMPDSHLVIAGPDEGGFGKVVWRWLESLKLQERATMPGMLLGPEKLALLADTDVWVLPSYTENFAVAAVEAMACGRPVVITDRVNIHKEVSRAGAGLVVPCQATAISAAILRILADSTLRHSLAAHAAELVRNRFTWDAAVTRLIEVYEGLWSRNEKLPLTAG